MKSELTWVKSSYTGGNQANCVEIAVLPNGGRAVRDSKDPGGAVLVLTAAQWTRLRKSLLAGPAARPCHADKFGFPGVITPGNPNFYANAPMPLSIFASRAPGESSRYFMRSGQRALVRCDRQGICCRASHAAWPPGFATARVTWVASATLQAADQNGARARCFPRS
jgi:hypothetical protein